MRFTSTALAFLLASSARTENMFGTRAFRPMLVMNNRATGGAVRRQRTTIGFAAAAAQASNGQLYSQQNCSAKDYNSGVCKSLLSTRGGSTTTTSTALNSAIAQETEKAAPVENFRLDYKPLPHLVTKVNMDFNIHDGKTTVVSELTVEANRDVSDASKQDMVLDGDETSVKLLELSIDGRDLKEGDDYELKKGKLIIKGSALSSAPGDSNTLRTAVEIVPEDNTQLSGLYKSGPMYCTQCEAEGFRRITYYPDRPDNMAVFDKIRIEANKDDYPVLLSNGNRIDTGDVEGSDGKRHYATWSDPYPKPSYLFAVVAGNLGSVSDEYTTTSGRKVHLEIFSEKENTGKLDYAMKSLINSMKWDEDKFGLEYDLDLYNIVAVNDFNMGAMENKGLNIFNTAYVLADAKTASDTDYERIEGVIGHEYFHNWTGNRVTCRDWFQLTLKEGLTVFRDQEFSGDMNSNAVKRIEDVRGLRARQFNEDAGPMSHPIRPESYISMDNFYTSTVYNKGAEVIRMYNTILGEKGFRKGMDLYFQRHDGQGVTCDDFRLAMADANGVDLEQFALWYSTSGTPTVTYSSEYDSDSGKFTLTLSQTNKANKPLHIPVSVGLLDKKTGSEAVPTKVLELKEMKQSFTFDDLEGDVVPSILRGFSAPVKLVPESGVVDESDLAFLAAHDTDGFNKWEAGQKLYTSLIFETMKGETQDETKDYVLNAFGKTLTDQSLVDYSIQAYALTLPSEATLAEEVDVVDPVAIRDARSAVKKTIARQYYKEIKEYYGELTKELMADSEFKVDSTSIGRRRIRNVLLDYQCSLKETPDEQKEAANLATEHYDTATGMTDKLASLSALVSMDGEFGSKARDEALQKFYDEANGDALVLDKWFGVQAMSTLPDVLDRVKKLTEHPDFTLSNPNRCRSLISVFTMNSAPFHDVTGAGYEFLYDILVKLDKLNPQISSRIAGSLIQWKRYDEERGALMKEQLEKLASMKPVSDNLFEVVSRGLK